MASRPCQPRSQRSLQLGTCDRAFCFSLPVPPRHLPQGLVPMLDRGPGFSSSKPKPTDTHVHSLCVQLLDGSDCRSHETGASNPLGPEASESVLEGREAGRATRTLRGWRRGSSADCAGSEADGTGWWQPSASEAPRGGPSTGSAPPRLSPSSDVSESRAEAAEASGAEACLPPLSLAPADAFC